MKISFNWLKEFIHFNHSPEEIAEILTQTGLEVEGIEQFETVRGGLKGLLIGEVKETQPHPSADKLKLTKVDIGKKDYLSIVCGAPNVAKGQKVVVAPVGSILYPSGKEPMKMKKAKIRGEVSEGMICAEDELGLGHQHDGILELDTTLPNGSPASNYFNIENDFIFEIGLTPNRADAASHNGVARDLKAVLGTTICFPPLLTMDENLSPCDFEVIVENVEACPRYSALVIENITVKDSPQWLKNRLKAIGLTPINNIVDATNYVLHELGQPLHAFDADKISGNKVIIKTLPEGTPFTTLDEKERLLTAEDLMICNEKEGMCIAGVFGGMHSGISKSTKKVFLESAYFSPDYIRKTAQHHGLKTDAAFRYERGTDPNITVLALQRAAFLIQEIAGGSVLSAVIDHYPHPISDFHVKVSYRRLIQLIGQPLEKDQIKSILFRLDIKMEDEDEDTFIAIIPPYRVDVQREADIVEEVIRIYGLNNVKLDNHLGTNFIGEFPEFNEDDRKLRLSELLVADGFSEIMTNSLTNKKYAEQSSWLDSNKTIHIENKLSEELNALRQTPIFGGLETINYNLKRQAKELKLFEWATTYQVINRQYVENNKLCFFMAGENQPENWQQKNKPVDFYDLAKTVIKVFTKLSIKEYQYIPIEEGPLAYGTKLQLKGKTLAALGRLSNDVTALVETNKEVFYAEINWDEISTLAQQETVMKEISRFPSVRRDLSLVLDKNVNFQEVKEVALKYSNKLIQDINVFDVYEGDKLEEGKKAYAMSFILEDKNKTLTDKVIDKTMNKLISIFESELGAIIRK